MARSIATDLLQVFPFWLFDAAPVDPLSLPMLTPLFGFSAVTAPEVTVGFTEITEGNWFFKKKVVKNGDVSNMTLQRGATFYDSDFWRWTLNALSGGATTPRAGGSPSITSLGGLAGSLGGSVGGLTPRRTLMLVHFLSRPTFGGTAGAVAAAATQAALAAGAAALSGAGGVGSLVAGVQTGILGSVSAAGLGPFEFVSRIPAKAWMLYGCLPARYKAGSDFDATSSAISIQELDITIEMMEEVSLTA